MAAQRTKIWYVVQKFFSVLCSENYPQACKACELRAMICVLGWVFSYHLLVFSQCSNIHVLCLRRLALILVEDAEIVDCVQRRRVLGSPRWISCEVCVSAMCSGLSSFIYYPALTSLSRPLHVSIELINLSITSSLVVSGSRRPFWETMADQTGRRPVSLVAQTLYFAANVGLALQDNYAALLILRCVQSAGASVKEMQLWCSNCNLTRAFMLTWYDLILRETWPLATGLLRHCSASRREGPAWAF